MPRTVFCVILLFLAIGGQVYGRFITPWPYRQLTESSTVVVIGTRTKQFEVPVSFTDKRWPLKFQGIVTVFEVQHVVKGEPREKQIEILHFKAVLPRDSDAIEDGPMLVDFSSKDTLPNGQRGGREQERQEFLLFLKLSDGGRYEPVSGRIDPVLSVRRLRSPFPD
ncbi:MAG: hypothetical protein U0744_07710 [Gemmataceae bacterium]